ncbi:phage associated protein [Neisseria gonorrhoeae]|uniref:Phage associated protein n=1 Tax=Neisseria gonorrhoeae TaxID=485 RepID=A0A378VSN8_NEIGO|nr:phage associated protein [Neisseria gonorrhoeae]
MNRYAMRFAVIRFMPYVQTREFANIGIIITHPQSGCFDFKIEHRYSRLSRFSAASIRPPIKRRPVPLKRITAD